MQPKCSRVVYSECPGKCAHNVFFSENFGKTLKNVRNILNVPGFPVFLIFIYSVPKVFPKFSEKNTLWAHFPGHSEYTTLEHFGCIVPVHFEFYWLGKLWLLHQGHRKEHFGQSTQEHCGNILWEHFEFPHTFPNQEITWEHCEWPEHFPSWGHFS
jgi:hypothetical protein